MARRVVGRLPGAEEVGMRNNLVEDAIRWFDAVKFAANELV